MKTVYFGAGSLYKFNYMGGENPGAARIVYSLSINSQRQTMSAYCFTRKEVRTFSLDKCKNADYVDDYIEVELQNLPKNMRDGEILEKNYEADGYECYVDSPNNLLVAVKVPTKSSVVMAFGFKNCIKVMKNGKSKFIYITGQTAEELIKDLSAIG